MEETELGFILRKTDGQDSSYSVFTRTAGKVELELRIKKRPESLHAGTLVSFVMQRKRIRFIAREVALVMHPVCPDPHLLYFLHHILELTYYFVPLSDPFQDLFTHLYQLIHAMGSRHHLFELDYEMAQRLFLTKFFVLLGYYPEGNITQQLNRFEQILRTYVDLPTDDQVNCLKRSFATLSEPEIAVVDKWIVQRINEHPCRHLFKTVRFMQKAKRGGLLC